VYSLNERGVQVDSIATRGHVIAEARLTHPQTIDVKMVGAWRFQTPGRFLAVKQGVISRDNKLKSAVM
jgi:hypothetical protein